MSVRRADNSRPEAPDIAPEGQVGPKAPAARTRASITAPAVGTPREPVAPARSSEEAEERYVTARDAWVAAMRKANSGRSADLASLAIAQEAYVMATSEVEAWRSGVKVAFKIDPEAKRHNLEAAIGQEFAWRRVHDQQEKRPGPLARLFRRGNSRRD
jgi:hypothetical protein